jgi:hypothetical protein
MWTSKSGSCSSIAPMKPGKLARSRSCCVLHRALAADDEQEVDPPVATRWVRIAEVRDVHPAVPVLKLPLLLVADPVDVEVESSAGSPLDEELPVDDSDSAAVARWSACRSRTRSPSAVRRRRPGWHAKVKHRAQASSA